ncbi:hypothetical protein [Methylobacterium sp. A54F]
MSAAALSSRGRRPLLAGLVGLAALGLAAAAGGAKGLAVSYLAAWLVLLGLPVGALPLVMILARVRAHRPDNFDDGLLTALRRVLRLMPVAALLGLPILLGLGLIYPWTQGTGAETALARIWFTGPFFALRVLLYLGAWLWIARTASDPRGDGPAILAVWVLAVVAILAATDLVGSLDPRLGSSLLGILLIAAWSGLALAAALLLAPDGPRPSADTRSDMLAVLLGLWAFLHFVQFLIVWSANLPQEVLWYFARGGLAGRGLSILGGALILAAALATLRHAPTALRGIAAASFLVHALEMFWFVTPSVRDRFVVSWTDAFAALGVAGLAAALVAGLPGLDRAARRTPA